MAAGVHNIKKDGMAAGVYNIKKDGMAAGVYNIKKDGGRCVFSRGSLGFGAAVGIGM